MLGKKFPASHYPFILSFHAMADVNGVVLTSEEQIQLPDASTSSTIDRANATYATNSSSTN